MNNASKIIVIDRQIIGDMIEIIEIEMQKQIIQHGGIQVNKIGIEITGWMNTESIKQKYDVIIGQMKLAIVKIKNSTIRKIKNKSIILPIQIIIIGYNNEI